MIETSIAWIRLHDVVGRPTGVRGILFVPALFDFEEGQEGRAECLFQDHPGAESLDLVSAGDEIEAEHLLNLWGEARIRAVFRTPCSVLSRPDNYWGGFGGPSGVPFVAASRFGEADGPCLMPFLCLETEEGPALLFGRDADPKLKEQIASAFYEILLRDPTDLAPFDALSISDSYDEEYEEGWCVELGYARGEFSARELLTWVPDDLPDDYPTQPLWLFWEQQVCPECGGCGEESFCPAGEVCEACEGRGELKASCRWYGYV